MKQRWLIPLLASLLGIAFCAVAGFGQSLGEVARKEAERRKRLEQEGVTAKVIEERDAARLGASGNLAVFSRPAGGSQRSLPSSDRERGSPSTFRVRLQKLDRQIRQVETSLMELRERARRERWAPPRTGRLSRRPRDESAAERMQSQIRSLENKLKSLRQERSETYTTGRKAGFLPGELDGKGIIP